MMFDNSIKIGSANLNSAPESIKNINLKWFYAAPFFSEFLFRIKFESRDDIETIGVKARKGIISIKIGTNGWWDNLSDNHKEGVLVHEILHLVHESHATGRTAGLDHKIANIAADICINHEIEQSTLNGQKLTLPRPGCFLEDIQKKGYDGKVITEDIYEWLRNNPDSMDGTGEGEMKPFDEHDLEEMDEITKATIKEITHIAKMRGYGTVSGNMKDFIHAITNPTVDWKHQLRSFTKSLSTRSIIKSQSWTKKNRRSLPLPGKKHDGLECYLAIDTSGSTYEFREDFFSEIDHLASFTSIHLLQCDTELFDSGKYKKGAWRDINIQGGGGTVLQPIFDYMRDNKKLNAKLIVFTDGEFSKVDTYGINVLWVLTKHDSQFEQEYSNNDVVVIEK